MGLMRGRGRRSPTSPVTATPARSRARPGRRPASTARRCSSTAPSALVTIPDAASLHLTTGMTLEAWVNPSTVNDNWRDVIYKGNDNYYLEATSSNASKPDAGLIAGGSYADAYGSAALTANSWTLPGRNLRRHHPTPLRQRHPGRLHRPHRHDQHLHQPTADRRRQHLRPKLRRHDRRSPHLQHRPHPHPNPNRPNHPGQLDRLGARNPECQRGEHDRGRPLLGGRYRGASRATRSSAAPATNCSNFAQIGTNSTTTYKDTTVTANNTYSYRVRATDGCRQRRPVLQHGNGDDRIHSVPEQCRAYLHADAAVHGSRPRKRERHLARRRCRRRQQCLRDDHVRRSLHATEQRRDAHDLRNGRSHHGQRHRLRHERPRHVHVPQRQHANRSGSQRDRADAVERQIDDVREAVQLPARRSHARLARFTSRTSTSRARASTTS